MNSAATGLLPATEPEQAQFFARLQEGFLKASARTGEIVRDFRLAGTQVRLRFAGEALLPVIVPGLANHPPVGEPGPACEVCVWDSESTGVSLAPPPRPFKDFTRRGNIWGFDSPRYRSAYHWGEGSVNAMDRETRQAFFWVPTHQHVPMWVLASPLRSILHWWMELNGRQLVHAAAVGWGGRGALIPGRSGSGKSSTALACLLAGMDFVSDDYLALAVDPEPRAYRLYSTAKLDPRSLLLHPELAARCRTFHQPGFDKVVLFLEDGYAEQLQESLPINLALRPWISGAPETALGKAEPLEIESALACETLGHLPHSGAATVEFLNRFAREVPRSAIFLGTERACIPPVIQQALASPILDGLPHRPAQWQPFISVMVHFHQEDREELRALAAEIEAQGYPRTEFVVVASGSGAVMQDEASKLPGTVRFFPYPEAIVQAEAWNRGIREAFAELLLLIEPGDRLPSGALEALARASEMHPAAAWVSGQGSPESLRGALVRKSAFREYGLFPADPFFQGREQQTWLRRMEEKGLSGRTIETVTLRAARQAEKPLLRPRPELPAAAEKKARMSTPLSQRLLLDALLLPAAAAAESWRDWRALADVNSLDKGSFHLLPALTARLPDWLTGDPQRAILLGICRRAWSQNQLQRKLLADAVQVLLGAGIDRVAATGPIVWGSLYWPTGAIRPVGEVDLLIEPACVRPAFEALARAGWKAPRGIPDTEAKPFHFAAGAAMLSPSGNQVRIHWRALPNTDLSLQRPEFPPLEPLPPDSPAPYTIPPEHSLVAALGGVHDDGIGWHLDAFMICRHPGLRWEVVAALLRRRSAQRKRLDELRRECAVGIPPGVTTPAWSNVVEQILASMLRAYRRRRIK